MGKFEGKLLVFTAPSGAGKTTIVRHLLAKYDVLDFSVSATTRAKREYEEDGRDYYFISITEFQQRIRKEEFVEWEEVYHDQYYGTLKTEIERLWSLRKHIVFDIDVKGATAIKKQFGAQCLSVFIKPPSVEVLIKRLTDRRTESAESLNKRIARVKREMAYENKFDKLLVNDMLQVAIKEAEFIVEEFLGLSHE